MPNYTDPTKPQITAQQFILCRTGKDISTWEVEVREVEFANHPTAEKDFSRSAGGFSFQVNPAKCEEEFAIVDPVTLEPTARNTTYNQVFGLIQSAYMHEARKRDEQKDVPLG